MNAARVALVALALAWSGFAQAGISFDPDPPEAGRPLEVRLDEALRVPGHELRLRDPMRDREIGRFRFGRFPPGALRFDLPGDSWSLSIELLVDGAVTAHAPAEGMFLLTPTEGEQPRPGATLAECDTLPPETSPDDDRGPLLAWVEGCVLDHAPLRGRDLRAIELSERSLWRADLRGADLSDARLRYAELGGASLAGARLDGANLAGARLELADLQGASLFVTDLDGADLRNADLREADLSHASFSNADLTGARLQGAVLDGTDFTGAICPDGTRAEAGCRDHLELP